MRLIVEYQRRFQIWKYSVTHAHLLLRANKGVDNTSRIEVLFVNVKAISLPTSLNGLTINELSSSEASEQYADVIASLYMKNVAFYMLNGSDYSGYIIAGAVFIKEDQQDYDAPSMFDVS